MNYRIVDKEGFEIIGKCKKVTTDCGKQFETIPKFWEESYNNGLCEKLFKIAGSLGVLGVCTDFEHDKGEFTYVIAVEKLKTEVPDDLVEKEIPAATWAIFEAVGPIPGALQEVWKRIFSEWFPATGYEHADAPELEIYLPGNPNDSNYKCEVWIPIIKK